VKAWRGFILLAVLAGLAGCGGDDDSGDEARAVSLTITTPRDGERTGSASTSVVGTVTGAAEVTVNGKPATLRPAGAARSFEVPVRLRVGENEIVVEASGGTRSVSKTVTVIRKRGRRGGGDDSPGESGGSGGEQAEAPPSQGAPPAPSQGGPGAPAAPPNQGAPPSPSAPPDQGAPPAPAPPPQGAPPSEAE
jgi:hypothetical protein